MTRIIAHRGASAAFPEHTRAAYVEALAQGADGLECDVQLTADGAVVLWHDATLDRTSDAVGPLHERTLAELRALDVWSWKGTPPDGNDDQLLTLTDLVGLAVAAGRPVTLVVELKHPSPAGQGLEDAVLATLAASGWDAATGRVGATDVDVTFMSFSPASQRHLAATVPPEQLMFLVDEVDDADLVAELAPDGGADPAAVARLRALVADARADVVAGRIGGLGPSVAWCRAHPGEIRAAVALGRTVRVWTVDDPDDARFLVGLGVTELTTNRPGDLRAELEG
ncbi:glycerophosphodiester phosphodiesterase family protein [Sanguibacter sp. HDW7]|uniref:glycerophosphodiester phosphodiesterase n=1 Tax=Sanguibacter sp. HDW7 TaxID=2714931 RepID=UPI00140DDFBA|nr:glycerophosphodiester phosphodiesterase family protein [Sanguibacter sp. HDW7]QIK84483.1 glycerophosphodiester phosphodiesterase [Sanguibacter sp. HDW7]